MSQVVLVEDDALFVKMYQKKFSKEGISLEVALDGEAGFNKIKEVKPDLAILDLMLPKMSGTEVLRKIRSDESLKEIPVIIMTNLNASSDEVNQAMELGVKETVLKTDVVPEKIVETARKYLK
ncbi:MAG TPA: response regulator [Candidatus Saccharimonadales bacterium]|nr:response regulator [Candidatus Saccharimonadales bacterium]